MPQGWISINKMDFSYPATFYVSGLTGSPTHTHRYTHTPQGMKNTDSEEEEKWKVNIIAKLSSGKYPPCNN